MRQGGGGGGGEVGKGKQLNSRFMCAAVVELHLRAGDHLTGLL